MRLPLVAHHRSESFAFGMQMCLKFVRLRSVLRQMDHIMPSLEICAGLEVVPSRQITRLLLCLPSPYKSLHAADTSLRHLASAPSMLEASSEGSWSRYGCFKNRVQASHFRSGWPGSTRIFVEGFPKELRSDASSRRKQSEDRGA